jgi:MraZ protein
MMLTGNFRRSLDEKLRLSIPKPLRMSLGFPELTNLYIAPGTDKSLVIYTLETLEKLGTALEKLSPAGKQTRAFARLFYSQIQNAEVDRQGRMRVPSELAALAGIKSDVVVVGAGDRIELWDTTHWDSFLQKNQPIYDELAESVLGECLGQRQPNPSSSFDTESPLQ